MVETDSGWSIVYIKRPHSMKEHRVLRETLVTTPGASACIEIREETCGETPFAHLLL